METSKKGKFAEIERGEIVLSREDRGDGQLRAE